MTNHILIGGDSGAGKSYLIRRLLELTDLKISGFMTELDRLHRDEGGMFPLYIYPASMRPEDRIKSAENLLGSCAGRDRHKAYTARFDELATKMVKEAEPEDLLVMDELGFLEAEAMNFREAVIKAFDRKGPIIAVVKERYDVPFLNEIRALPGTELYTVTPDNREQLFEALAKVVNSWE